MSRIPAELESLADTLDLLSDPVAMAELAESDQALADGDFITGEELRALYPPLDRKYRGTWRRLRSTSFLPAGRQAQDRAICAG